MYKRQGGALGFDTLAALTVLKCKKKYSQVKLFMIYPCKNQTKGWDKKSTLLYEYIKKQADSFLYLSLIHILQVSLAK